jgi:hypothetical protein
MGYKSTTKLAIMNGSYRYGGAQLLTCWDLQGSTHLSMLIGHLQLKDIVGQHLLHEMDYLYLHIGFQQRVMSYPITDTQSLAPDCWVTNTWHYLSSLDGTTISTSIELPLQRERDTAIMKQASKFYNGIKLKRINAVRLFLQVFFLSDITTSDGKQISTEYRYSNKLRRRTSILNWPIQAEPGALAWTEWRKMLKECHTHRDFTLRSPLGCWLDASSTQTWHTIVYPPTDTVYVKHDNLWHLYTAPPLAPALQSPSLLPATIHPQLTRYSSLLILQQTTVTTSESTLIQTGKKFSYSNNLQQPPSHNSYAVSPPIKDGSSAVYFSNLQQTRTIFSK